jgi:hypothetical protein
MVRWGCSGATTEAAAAEELATKHAALTLYCKRKNLEMRRMLHCYKSLKTQWERAGGSPDSFDARAAEVDAAFDLKAAQRKLEQMTAELVACRQQLRAATSSAATPMDSHVLRPVSNKEAVVAGAHPGKENARVG